MVRTDLALGVRARAVRLLGARAQEVVVHLQRIEQLLVRGEELCEEAFLLGAAATAAVAGGCALGVLELGGGPGDGRGDELL